MAVTSTRPSIADRAATGDDRLLLAAAWLFTIAVVLHGLDHNRRGVDSVAFDVLATGSAAVSIEITVVALIAQRHRWGPLAAVVTGFALAAGYVVVHFLPDRGWLSDSLPSATDVSALTWAAASLEVAAAVLLGVVGWLVLQRRGGLVSASTPRTEQRSAQEGLTHPVTLTMIAGSAVVLTVVLVQLLT